MTSAGSGDERIPRDSGRDDGRAAASIPEQQPPPTPTRRSPLVRAIAALAIVLILVALWVLTWAVVTGALTSDDGPFRNDPARNGTVSGAPVSTIQLEKRTHSNTG